MALRAKSIDGMNVVILCGGQGTRLKEETEFRPKPLVPIGGRPILWHIMKHYSAQGLKDFYCALGYKGELVKQYFYDYHVRSSSIRIDLKSKTCTSIETIEEDWDTNLVDTGELTNTAGRIKRLEPYLANRAFFLSYGDSLSDVKMNDVIKAHSETDNIVTLTAVRPPSQFGVLELDGNQVRCFNEKPRDGGNWINGGFMVIEPQFFRYINNDTCGLEVLSDIALCGKLGVYRHDGYWQCMDTIRDKELLEAAWLSGTPGWKTW